jgi:hypothetical protein
VSEQLKHFQKSGRSLVSRQLISEIREEIGLLNRTVLALLLDEFRDEAGPAGLMRRSEAGAGVAMKVFVEPIAALITVVIERPD